jgi:hypothetical protein
MLKNLIEQAQANLPFAILFAIGLIWFLLATAQYYVDFAKITPSKEDDEKAKRFKLHVQAFVKFLKNLFRIGKKPNDKGFVNSALLEIFGYISAGVALGLLISNFLIPAKVEVVKDESMNVEYQALKSAYAEEVAENQKLKSEQVVKSRVLIKNVDGSSREEEHSDSKSLEVDIYLSKAKISNQEEQISYLQQQLHEYRKETKVSWGVRAMVDFSKDNKHLGYRAGGHIKYFTADAVMRDNKYDGYSLGLIFNN